MSTPRPTRLLALAFGLVVSALVVEGAARATDLEARWLPDLAWFQSADVALHRQSADRDLGYELRPLASSSLRPSQMEGNGSPEAWWSDPRVVRVNALGHRGPPRRWERPTGVFRVLCLGGSNTFGAAVSNDETWPAALELALQARTDRPVEVWNLGVNAYVTEQKVALARRSARARPDLYLFQLANRGARPLLRDDDLDVLAAFEADPRRHREVLVGAPAPGGILGALWRASAGWRMLVVAANRAARGEGSPLADGVRTRIDARSDASARAAFAAFLEEADAPVLVVHPPTEAGPSQVAGLPVPELDLRGEPGLPSTPDARDLHPGAAVYRWYGARIAEHLEASGCLSGGCAFSGSAP